MEFGPIRAMDGDTITSPSYPRLGIRINPDYIYLGDLQYISRETFHVEEFIFLEPNGAGHATRLLLVQFAGYLDNKQGTYEYPTGPTVSLDGEDYLYDLFFIDLPGYFEQFPNSDLSHAADYVRQRAYTLAGEMTYQRFLRLVSPDKRHEFIIAYLENNETAGVNPETLPQDATAMRALRERALQSFTILH